MKFQEIRSAHVDNAVAGVRAADQEMDLSDVGDDNNDVENDDDDESAKIRETKKRKLDEGVAQVRFKSVANSVKLLLLK